MQSKIIRFIAALLSLTSFANPAFAQSPEENALDGAQQMIEAIALFDAKTVAKWLPPKLKEALGGEANTIQIFESKFQGAQKSGIEFQTKFLGVPTTPSMTGDTLFTFIPYMFIAHNQTTRITHSAYYLGVSYDSGEKWYFIDGIELTPQTIKFMLPDYTGQPPPPKVERKSEPRFRLSND